MKRTHTFTYSCRTQFFREHKKTNKIPSLSQLVAVWGSCVGVTKTLWWNPTTALFFVINIKYCVFIAVYTHILAWCVYGGGADDVLAAVVILCYFFLPTTNLCIDLCFYFAACDNPHSNNGRITWTIMFSEQGLGKSEILLRCQCNWRWMFCAHWNIFRLDIFG